MLKYGRSTAVVSALADSLASAAPSVDLVTWCPARGSPTRARFRPVRTVGGRRPPHRCAGAVDPDPYRPHAADHPSGRAPRRSIVAVARSARSGPSVLLIDDVTTTGATLTAAARLLRSGGALAVHGSVVTRLGGVRRAPREREVYGRLHNRSTEVLHGRLHQRTARERHAATGGGDPRKNWHVGSLPRRAPTREVHFDEARDPRIEDKEFLEVVVEGHGHHLRAKVNARDPYSAVDQATLKLERQIRKLRTRLQKRHHGDGRSIRTFDTAAIMQDLSGQPAGGVADDRRGGRGR